jgi:hypothetical protein
MGAINFMHQAVAKRKLLLFKDFLLSELAYVLGVLLVRCGSSIVLENLSEPGSICDRVRLC